MAATLVDAEMEIRPAVAGGPEGIVYRGFDGLRQFWPDVDAAWAEFRIDPQELEFRDPGGRDRVEEGGIDADRMQKQPVAVETAGVTNGWTRVRRG